MAKAARSAAARGGAANRGTASSTRQPNAKPNPEGQAGRKPDMLKSGVKLEDLEGQDLRDYAKSAGVPGHVIASMTEEKLRRECLLKVQQFLDDLDD